MLFLQTQKVVGMLLIIIKIFCLKKGATDLVNKIKKLVVDEKLQEQIYYNLIKDIKKFDWEVVSEKYIQVYKNEISKFNKLK